MTKIQASKNRGHSPQLSSLSAFTHSTVKTQGMLDDYQILHESSSHLLCLFAFLTLNDNPSLACEHLLHLFRRVPMRPWQVACLSLLQTPLEPVPPCTWWETGSTTRALGWICRPKTPKNGISLTQNWFILEKTFWVCHSNTGVTERFSITPAPGIHRSYKKMKIMRELFQAVIW